MDEKKKEEPTLDISSKPIIRKKTRGERIADHMKAIGTYLWKEILMPAMKDTASSMAKSAVDMALYGESRNDDRRTSGNRDYNRISTTYYRSDSRTDRLRDYSDRSYKQSRELDDLVWSNRADAEKTLDYLQNQIDTYGQAYLADLYKKLGVDTDFPDYDAGWESLRGAHISMARNGYRLILPDPVRLR